MGAWSVEGLLGCEMRFLNSCLNSCLTLRRYTLKNIWIFRVFYKSMWIFKNPNCCVLDYCGFLGFFRNPCGFSKIQIGLYLLIGFLKNQIGFLSTQFMQIDRKS